MDSRLNKIMREAGGLITGPRRIFPLVGKVAHDRATCISSSRNLYSYATTRRPSAESLSALVNWILRAQRSNGGIAAYYSLFSGYSESYPEVTGYIVPTLYDFALLAHSDSARGAAERATNWLLSLQLSSGAFPAGLHGRSAAPSVFNTGQILQGLVRSWTETNRPEICDAAFAAADWLLSVQSVDGSWPTAYQDAPHTYYSMVAWSLAQLSECTGNQRYGLAAERNLDWVLKHIQPGGWIDGINLRGHPSYLHFVAYIIQGVLECALLRHRKDAVQAISAPAWILLRKFETAKHLPGAFDHSFASGRRFTCLTGNAQMSCVWLRLFDGSRSQDLRIEGSCDLRYLNAALKMNESLKPLLPTRGSDGVVGGVAGSYPIWAPYQPFRYISWGCKFFADALMLEQRLLTSLEASACAS